MNEVEREIVQRKLWNITVQRNMRQLSATARRQVERQADRNVERIALLQS